MSEVSEEGGCKICKIPNGIKDLKEHYNDSNHQKLCPLKLLVSGFSSDFDLGKCHEYFGKFGKISQLICKRNIGVIEYNYSDKNATSEVINQEHVIEGVSLKVTWDTPEQLDAPNPELAKASGSIPEPSAIPERNKVEIINALKAISVNTFDDQVLALQKILQCNQTQFQFNRNLIISDLSRAFQSNFRQAQIHYFGSSITRLDYQGSDLDIYVNNVRKPNEPEIQVLKKLKTAIIRSTKFSDFLLITQARVPIIKCIHARTRTCIDLNVNSMHCVYNSKLINFYLSMDEKLRPLMITIKYLADIHKFKRPNFFSSYSLCMLFIFYLQQPPYNLPALVDMQYNSTNLQVGWNCGFAPVKDFDNSSLKNASILEIFLGFFRFYARFDFYSQVICPYLGRSVPKIQFFNPKKLPNSFWRYKDAIAHRVPPLNVIPPIVIQDPFDHARNIGAMINANFLGKFGMLCHKWSEFKGPELNVLLDLMKDSAADVGAGGHQEFVFEFTNQPDGDFDDFFAKIRKHTGSFLIDVMNCTANSVPNPIYVPEAKFGQPTTYIYTFNCSGANNVWVKRTVVMAKHFQSLNEMEKEKAVTEWIVKNASASINLNFLLTVVVMKDPVRIKCYVKKSNQKCKSFPYIYQFLRIKLPLWLTYFALQNPKTKSVAENCSSADAVEILNDVNDRTKKEGTPIKDEPTEKQIVTGTPINSDPTELLQVATEHVGDKKDASSNLPGDVKLAVIPSKNAMIEMNKIVSIQNKKVYTEKPTDNLKKKSVPSPIKTPDITKPEVNKEEKRGKSREASIPSDLLLLEDEALEEMDEHNEEEEEEDVPADFFDDFSNQDFMDGLDIVDAWDDDVRLSPIKEIKSQTNQLSRGTSKSREIRRKSPEKRRRSPEIRSKDNWQSRSLVKRRRIRSVSRGRVGSGTYKPRSKSGSRGRKPRSRSGSRGRQPRSRSGSRGRKPRSRSGLRGRKPRSGSRGRKPRSGSDVHKPKTRSHERYAREVVSDLRRDPEKTKRDIRRDKLKCAKDKESKMVSDKLKLVETGLVPPGTEMDTDINSINPLKTKRSPLAIRHKNDSLNVYSSERERRFRRRSNSREVNRSSNGVRYSRSPVYRPIRPKERPRKRQASASSDISDREAWIQKRAPRKRSRSESPTRTKIKKQEQAKKKSFLEEIREKLNEVRPTPVQYSQPYVNSVPVPVPAPTQYFSPSGGIQQYDQNFFIGDSYNLGGPRMVNMMQPQLGGMPGNLGICGGYAVGANAAPPNVPMPQIQLNLTSASFAKISNSTQPEEAKTTDSARDVTIDKLFADKKISLSDFLTITAKPEVHSSTPEHLQKKIKVISRCQDAIRAMSDDRRFAGRLNVQLSQEQPNKPDIKFQSPLRKIPIVRFQFTTPSKGPEESDVFAVALDKVLQKLGIIKDTIDLDEVVDLTKSNKSLFAGEESASIKAAQQLSGRKPSDSPRCDECRKRNLIVFADVGTQCVDGKETNTIETQVCEEDLNPPKVSTKESMASLTPAQLLGKEKELQPGPKPGLLPIPDLGKLKKPPSKLPVTAPEQKVVKPKGKVRPPNFRKHYNENEFYDVAVVEDPREVYGRNSFPEMSRGRGRGRGRGGPRFYRQPDPPPQLMMDTHEDWEEFYTEYSDPYMRYRDRF